MRVKGISANVERVYSCSGKKRFTTFTVAQRTAHRLSEDLRTTDGVNMNAPNHIRVWAFQDAPEELRALSPHSGDEDWLALLPPKFAGHYIGWMEGDRSAAVMSVCIHTRSCPDTKFALEHMHDRGSFDL